MNNPHHTPANGFTSRKALYPALNLKIQPYIPHKNRTPAKWVRRGYIRKFRSPTYSQPNLLTTRHRGAHCAGRIPTFRKCIMRTHADIYPRLFLSPVSKLPPVILLSSAPRGVHIPRRLNIRSRSRLITRLYRSGRVLSCAADVVSRCSSSTRGPVHN